MDVEDLKKPATHRIFHAWVEDWEKEILTVNDCVLEARLLKKYKDLIFHDLDNDKVLKIWGGNAEFHCANRMLGTNKGWGLVAIDEDGEECGWEINDNLCEMIADREQAAGVEVIRKEEAAA